MATLSEIVARVELIVDDTSLSAEIPGVINEGLEVIAGKVKLPALDTSYVVTTDTDDDFVSLPSDYQRGLYRCERVADGVNVAICNSLGQLIRKYGENGVGDAVAVAVVGGNLYYRQRPSTVNELRLYYYRTTTPLEDDGDIPDCLPARFQKSILSAYAAAELFEILEDGEDGATPNSKMYQDKFARLLIDLEKETREGVSNPVPRCTGCDL